MKSPVPIPNPQSDTGREAERLAQEVAAIDAKIAAVPNAQREARLTMERATREIEALYTEAAANGREPDKAKVSVLQGKITKAKKEAETDRSAELSGYHAAKGIAQSRYVEFVEENLEALLGELEPEATKIQSDLVDLVGALEEWTTRYAQHVRVVRELTRIVRDPENDLKVRRDASLPIADLRRLANRPPMPYPDYQGIRDWKAKREAALTGLDLEELEEAA